MLQSLKKFATEKFDSILKDRRWLLALAIDTVIESMKQDQFKENIDNDKLADELNQRKC